MIRRILVAVDDSSRAQNVVAKAAEIAAQTSASLRLFQVVAIPPEFPPAAATENVDALPAFLNESAHKRLTELASRITGVPCEVLIKDSHRISSSILEAAQDYEADLIVIGSHGYTFVDRLLGTTAAAVANNSTRDVLVVHSQMQT